VPEERRLIRARSPIVLICDEKRKPGVEKAVSTRGGTTGSRPLARTLFTYAIFVGLCFAVALAGGIANSHGLAQWYPALAKPSFNPPNWVFAPVWSVLYVMIAFAGARLVLSPAREKEPAISLYFAQLGLNAAWSWVFFYGQAIGAAAVVILVLWLAILATIWLGWSKDRMASLLLIPYLVWVSFAAVLNLAIWHLNG
jgi:benzodiazapine receptor